jgi:carotenoid cleavage dioxygenase-like enzyme
LESEKVVDTWFAGQDTILDDFVLIPRGPGNNERQAWILAPVFQGKSRSTSFVILDASDMSIGPIAEIHLDDHHIPWALHGTWWNL